jgi:hypothetical protein
MFRGMEPVGSIGLLHLKHSGTDVTNPHHTSDSQGIGSMVFELAIKLPTTGLRDNSTELRLDAERDTLLAE